MSNALFSSLVVNIIIKFDQLISQILSIDKRSKWHAVTQDLLGLLKLLILRAIQIDVWNLLSDRLSFGRGLRDWLDRRCNLLIQRAA